MSDFTDRPPPEYAQEPAFPTTVTIAGVAWIAFGGLHLLSMVISLLVTFGMVGPGQGAEVVGGISFGLCLGLFGAAFIYVGVQSVTGTAPGTVGNGVGSIIFGMLNLGSGALNIGAGQVIQAGVAFLAGAGLFAAGVLALVGRAEYKAWRRARKARLAVEPGR